MTFLLMALPALICLVLFHYVPIGGIVLAFKDFNYVQGIFGSPWVGFENFKYIFKSDDIYIILRNTIGYHLAIMVTMNLIGGMMVALLLYEVRSRFANKLYQTAMIIPDFLSWIAISYIGLLLLNPESGILNQVLAMFGHPGINWYNEPAYWPFIIVAFQLWKAVGMASLYYYAALLNIDYQLFEAAELDGAGKFRQMWYISVPEMLPMACIVLITQLGSILSTNFDMFYQLPMNAGALYPTTNVLSTYIVRGLQAGNISTTAAVGLFQGVVGLVLILITNGIIRRVSPKNALF
ncbi:MAG TPA: sugar ABC transporter permease [Ruminococcaceae bacterium]|nr:sugar ABC transporter permease [Oscillospiraceae bacterium]